jgi:hypothetical protein
MNPRAAPSLRLVVGLGRDAIEALHCAPVSLGVQERHGHLALNHATVPSVQCQSARSDQAHKDVSLLFARSGWIGG